MMWKSIDIMHHVEIDSGACGRSFGGMHFRVGGVFRAGEVPGSRENPRAALGKGFREIWERLSEVLERFQGEGKVLTRLTPLACVFAC